MKTTVYISAEAKDKLSAVARSCDVSEAELIREGIDSVIERRSPKAPPARALFKSGKSDLASEVDVHLEGFGES